MSFFNIFKKKTNTPNGDSNAVKTPEQQSSHGTMQSEDKSSGVVVLAALLRQLEADANVDPVYGANVLPLITEYKLLYKEEAPKEKRSEAFQNLMQALHRTLLFVPVTYDKNANVRPDKDLHFSARAAIKFNSDSIVYRSKGMSLSDTLNLGWVMSGGVATIDLNWWDISRFSGCEGLKFADPNVSRGVMCPVTANAATGTCFLCYTGLDQMKASIGLDDKTFIGVFTLYDLVELMRKIPQISGLIINGNQETHCYIGRGTFKC